MSTRPPSGGYVTHFLVITVMAMVMAFALVIITLRYPERTFECTSIVRETKPSDLSVGVQMPMLGFQAQPPASSTDSPRRSVERNETTSQPNI
ncbi:MAG: hypothetical protein [Sanya fiers-like virus 4]|nr:MAG: hypothetical protein [Sanya fiers-like virus 4]UUW21181.1 MAG: hypothetical protein [Sanya fiers-like virus 4]UUW21185.1 MAG: hypothetical protein [Sanya fiers-like virus 4]UUW21189.1 MAG: hypothetical protein [Sanya fiers-like virus 4]